jgi:toxin ParE1/3/4
MPRFRIHHLVESEFQTVQEWYAGQSPLAAENFIVSFHSALMKIRSHPTAHAPWRPPYRRIRLARYPYLILFHLSRSTTSVLALVHEKRNPKRTLASLSKRSDNFS